MLVVVRSLHVHVACVCIAEHVYMYGVYVHLLVISVCLSACLSVCLSACLPACLSVCLSVCLSLCLSLTFVCLPNRCKWRRRREINNGTICGLWDGGISQGGLGTGPSPYLPSCSGTDYSITLSSQTHSHVKNVVYTKSCSNSDLISLTWCVSVKHTVYYIYLSPQATHCQLHNLLPVQGSVTNWTPEVCTVYSNI